MEGLLLTIPEALQLLRLGRTSLYKLLKGGEIAAVKIGTRTFIVKQSLVTFVASRPQYPVK